MRLAIIAAILLLAGSTICRAADAVATARDDKAAVLSLAEIGPKPKPVPRPDPKQIDASIRRGVAFLLKIAERQRLVGLRAELAARPRSMPPCPVPTSSFRAAVTSLCISALLRSGRHGPEVDRAIDRAEAWLIEYLPKIRRDSADALYNNWAHAYSIEALVRHARSGTAGRRRATQASAS